MELQADAWEITLLRDSEAACQQLMSQPYDLAVLSFEMPGISGLDILARLRNNPKTIATPVVLLTVAENPRWKLLALALRAADVFYKPIDPEYLIAGLAGVFRAADRRAGFRRCFNSLSDDAAEQDVALLGARIEAVSRLWDVAAGGHEEVGNHVLRVACYARVIATAMGLDRSLADSLFLAAPLHDIGKIAIPDAILMKKGPIDAEERSLVVRHCVIGANILKKNPRVHALLMHLYESDQHAADDWRKRFLATAASLALTHHEKWDGSGYPQHLTGEAIPLESRIVAIADVFDALVSRRSYRDALPIEQALKILHDSAQRHFAPDVYQAFLKSIPSLIAIQDTFPNYLVASGDSLVLPAASPALKDATSASLTVYGNLASIAIPNRTAAEEAGPRDCESATAATTPSIASPPREADDPRRSRPGMMEMTPTIDVNRVVENILAMTRNLWKQVAVAVTDLESGLPGMAWTPGALDHVLLNLIVNAAQAIQARAGRASKKGRITLRTRKSDSTIEISVEDTGAGIPDAIRDKVFEPLFSSRKPGEGAGQGLSIARAIVEHRGGTIRFDTVEGRGAVFKIRVPITQNAAGRQDAAASDTAKRKETVP
jgi:response regulator RpfG family c-di-GMP phosphodiesterase